LWQSYERQNRLHEAAGLFAPLLALRSLSMALSGTDFDHHRHFATAAEGYRRSLVKAMNDDMTLNADTAGFAYSAGPELWASLERFTYQPPATGWVVQRRGIALVVLLLWVFGAAAALRLQTRRLRVD
jgi:ABC-2 type transport system permease protein